MTTILLGTVALEPNRWGLADPDAGATIAVSDWTLPAAAAGFDGLEIWERHLTEARDAEIARVLDGPLPVRVFNSYVSLDTDDDAERSAVSDWVRRSGATGVKFNVGNDPDQEAAYAERIARWLDGLPAPTRLLCECHAGISVAESPEVAARILTAAGPADRVQAIVHSNESDDHLRARFDAYGDRIGHVHVNHLDHDGGPPPLAAIRDSVAAKAALLAGFGFEGTWTIEFVHGTLTDHDDPDRLMAQAIEDLAVLRAILA